MQHFHYHLLWDQFHGSYPTLSVALIGVYNSPGSTAWVETIDKARKEIISQNRCRLDGLSTESKVAIAPSCAQLRRKIDTKRGSNFDVLDGVLDARVVMLSDRLECFSFTTVLGQEIKNVYKK